MNEPLQLSLSEAKDLYCMLYFHPIDEKGPMIEKLQGYIGEHDVQFLCDQVDLLNDVVERRNLDNAAFRKMITGEIVPPKEAVTKYVNPYEKLSDKELYNDFNKLDPDEDYSDGPTFMAMLEEFGFRYIAKLHKKYGNKL